MFDSCCSLVDEWTVTSYYGYHTTDTVHNVKCVTDNLTRIGIPNVRRSSNNDLMTSTGKVTNNEKYALTS